MDSFVKIINSTKNVVKRNRTKLTNEILEYHKQFMSLEKKDEIFSKFYEYCLLINLTYDFFSNYGYVKEDIEKILSGFRIAKQKYFQVLELDKNNELGYEKYENKLTKLLD